MANKTLFGKEARDSLLFGIKTVHDATAMSLGARGRNAIFRQYTRPRITNDGVRIARTVDPEDEFAKLGADLLKEAAERTDSEAGDGTTTSIVLAYALIQEGLKALEEGANPMQLRSEIDEAVQKVLKELDEMAIKINDLKSMEFVAVVSVENKELGEMIASAALRAGVDGTVVVEEHDKPFNERKDVDGYRFDQGLISPYLITNPEKMEAIVTDCPILVTDKSWSLNGDLVPLIEQLHQQSFRNIVVIVEEMGGELLATLVKNSMSGLFRAVIVKKPMTEEVLEDIALVCGATTMTNKKGIVKPDFSYLGWADKVISNKDNTTIIGGRGDKKKIDKRIAELKELLPTLEGYEKGKIQQRIARLTGGVSIINIGAPTSAERNYLKLKADDAVNACRCALEDGIIPGGGVALRDIPIHLKTIGAEVVRTSIRKPFNLIVDSTGLNTSGTKFPIGSGVNAKTMNVEQDMIKAGIIDPVKVTKSALANAASLAGVFLTTEVAIVDLPRKNEGGYSQVS